MAMIYSSHPCLPSTLLAVAQENMGPSPSLTWRWPLPQLMETQLREHRLQMQQEGKQEEHTLAPNPCCDLRHRPQPRPRP